MKLAKRFTAIVLVMLMLFCMIPMQSVFAAESKKSGKIGDNLSWKYQSHTLTISGKGNMEWGDSYDKYPWFEFKDAIQKVVVKDGVTSITYDAFKNYKNLKQFSVSNSLRDVSPGALEGTAWYKAQPKGPVYLEHILYGFKGTMPENYTLKVKSGTTAISCFAIRCEDHLVGVSIPDSVTYIGDSAFRDCKNLSSIRMSKNVTYVGDSLFENTPWQWNQPDGMMYFGKVAYQYNGIVPKNTTITIKKGTVAIAPDAFSFQSGLKGIIIPDTVAVIGRAAFYGSGLKKINIPKSVKEIEWNRIDSSFLTSITVDPKNTVYASDERGALFNKKLTILYEYPHGNKETSYVLPKTTTQLSDHSLCGKYLKDISIPASVKKIDATAFIYCSNVTAFHVASGNKCFSSDKNGWLLNKNGTTLLQYPKGKSKEHPRVIIPKIITAIGDFAFANDYKVEEIQMSDSVKTVGQCAFSDCYRLSKIGFSKNIISIDSSAILEIPWCENQPDGVIYIGKVACCLKDWGNPIKRITIKPGITIIGERAFSGHTDLQKAELPKSVRRIREGAFDDCSKLKTIKIMNAKCKIHMAEDTFPKQATIYAAKGSTAQVYAETFGRKFVAI